MSIYEINLQGKAFDLTQYRNEFLVIVNIADTCGFSYQLQSLSELNLDSKLPCKVLAFPSNSFNQQVRDASEMQSWCDVNQKLSFPVYDIIEVNGANTHPIYVYLKDHARGAFGQQRITWNYTKFIVFPDEAKIKRFSPQTNIDKVVNYIKCHL